MTWEAAFGLAGEITLRGRAAEETAGDISTNVFDIGGAFATNSFDITGIHSGHFHEIVAPGQTKRGSDHRGGR